MIFPLFTSFFEENGRDRIQRIYRKYKDKRVRLGDHEGKIIAVGSWGMKERSPILVFEYRFSGRLVYVFNEDLLTII